jgi:16S rRNA (guanine1207-N2)-methyltransferase
VEHVSQVVNRNLDRLQADSVLLVDPAVDGLFQEVAGGGRSVSLSVGSHGAFRRFQSLGADVRFEACPQSLQQANVVILNLPREKQKLAMLLHAASRLMPADGRLWLAGANRAGIKSSPRVLEHFFASTKKLDSARHCGLYEASAPLETPPFTLDDYLDRWPLEHAGMALEIQTLPGVFAHGRLDKGTGLLLGVLENLTPKGRILDFASGSGVIGVSVLASGGGPEAVLLDDSALALEASRRTLHANGLEAESLPSDGLAELRGRFDWIISNPPFHRGVENDLDVAARFFTDAGTFLEENGKILVVFNRHLPYTGWLRKSFNRVDCLARNREFTVIQASKK